MSGRKEPQSWRGELADGPKPPPPPAPPVKRLRARGGVDFVIEESRLLPDGTLEILKFRPISASIDGPMPNDWRTPVELYAALNQEFSFTLDELVFFAWLIPLRKNMTQKLSGGRQVNDSNIWRVSRVPAAGRIGGREHNAQKPIELVRRALQNSTETGDLVLDFFVGSGTTIVACEAANRR